MLYGSDAFRKLVTRLNIGSKNCQFLITSLQVPMGMVDTRRRNRVRDHPLHEEPVVFYGILYEKVSAYLADNLHSNEMSVFRTSSFPGPGHELTRLQVQELIRPSYVMYQCSEK